MTVKNNPASEQPVEAIGAGREGVEPLPLPIDLAPRDGRMLRLWVRYNADSEEAWTPLDDAEESWTAGFNNFDNTGDDRWQFIGWDWSHDYLLEAPGGTVIGWLPFHGEAALSPAPPARTPMGEPQVLKGVGKINGDGWKDTTSIGEVVYVWNAEKPSPYAPGQYPRIDNEGWSASTAQYDFSPASVDEVRALTAPTPMGGELEALREAASGVADALHDAAHVKTRNLEAAITNLADLKVIAFKAATALREALAASSPSPAQGGETRCFECSADLAGPFCLECNPRLKAALSASPQPEAGEPVENLSEIISDAEIVRVHGYANFGSMTPREVVNDGILKTAVGYHCGHTQFSILRDHGLVTKPRLGSYDADLTKKGRAYARALYHRLAPPSVQPGEGK